ncbi:MAG: sodium:solute symporter [bacterium]
MTLSAIDLAVLRLYLAFSIGLGFYFAKFQKSAKEYFLGSRDISWPAVCLSIVATETSTLTFIGVPALSFGGNMAFMQITIGYLLARILVSLLFLPAYYRREMFTAYNFIEHRFGDAARKTASGIFMVTRLFADGVRIFATAIPLSLVTGLDYATSIAIICGVTIVYTYLGGLRAVVWMDVIQISIYLAGAVIAIFIMLGKIPGGWEKVLAIGGQADKFKFLDFDLNLTTTYTIFSGIIGGTLLGMASHGTDQLIVQRLLACRNLRDSQKALISSGFLVIVQFLFFLFIGAMLFVFYQAFPEKLAISRNDEIFPLFIATEMPPGIGGLIIAAIFAAAMSTLSSSLNSLASSSMNDWIKPLWNAKWSDKQELLFSRMATIAWAFLLVLVATLAGNWQNVLEAGLSIASLTYGSLLGAFLLGLSTRSFQQRDIILAMLAGVGMMLWVRTVGVAWPWFVPIGTTTTVFVGFVSQLIWGD